MGVLRCQMVMCWTEVMSLKWDLPWLYREVGECWVVYDSGVRGWFEVPGLLELIWRNTEVVWELVRRYREKKRDMVVCVEKSVLLQVLG